MSTVYHLREDWQPLPSGPCFDPGDVVFHRRYGYRGVVVELDHSCQAHESWYAANQTQPDRDQPWYHVLVHDGAQVTYVAEQNLVPEANPKPVSHPLIALFFSGFHNGHYLRNDQDWPDQ